MKLNTYKHWEGKIIQITGCGLSKQVIIGNIYILLYKHTHDFIIDGDFNINLLKTNEYETHRHFLPALIKVAGILIKKYRITIHTL